MHVLMLTAPEGNYFTFFYNLAFFIALAVLLCEGYRRRFPMLKWVLLLAFSRTMFIIGSKVVTFSLSDWQLVIQSFSLPDAPEKSLFGGILFSCGALLAGKYLLRFRQNFLDAFALALPLGIAVMRLGCFSAGCCFGKPASLPWSVQYPVNTLAHFHHFGQGLVQYTDNLSMPVHPVQLYETAGALIVFCLLVFLRNLMKAPGSLLALSFVMVLSVRFLAEFFRDPLAHTIGGNYWWVLNATQWGVLLVAAVLGVILWFREARPVRLPAEVFLPGGRGASAITRPGPSVVGNTSGPAPDLHPGSALLLLTVLSFVFFLLSGWFVYAEMLAIGTILFTGVVILAGRLVRGMILSSLRWVYLMCLAVPPLLISMAHPVNSGDSLLMTTYNTISAGLASGKLYNSHDIGRGSGCNRVSYTEYFEQDYGLFAAGYAKTRYNPADDTKLTYGFRLVAGTHEETRLSDRREKSWTVLGLTPYVVYDERFVGGAAGLHIGSLGIITENRQVEANAVRPETGTNRTSFYPQLYLRAGPVNYAFVDAGLASHFPSGLPGSRFQLGIGSSFGMDNGLLLRSGFSSHGMYLIGMLPLGDKFLFEPMFVYGKHYLDRERTNFQFSVGLHYRTAPK